MTTSSPILYSTHMRRYGLPDMVRIMIVMWPHVFWGGWRGLSEVGRNSTRLQDEYQQRWERQPEEIQAMVTEAMGE